jgi:hypothetical protein
VAQFWQTIFREAYSWVEGCWLWWKKPGEMVGTWDWVMHKDQEVLG